MIINVKGGNMMCRFWSAVGKRLSVLTIGITMMAGWAGAQDVKTVSMGKYISNCLYNFSRYIDWPADRKSGDFIITIVGSKDVYAEMEKLAMNKKVGLQSIQVKYVSNVNELTGYQHMVFINDWQSNKFSVALQKLSSSSTLIVTETEGMLGKGSMINFIPVDGLMQFEMDQDNLRKNKLMASAMLQKMAVNDN
jgi:hypothetical protein